MKMKMNFLFLLLSLTSLGIANADYVNPPAWQASRDYTHQSWDFGNDEMTEPSLPLLPDGEPNHISPADANSILTAIDYNVHPSFQYLIPYGLVGWRYEYESVVTSRRAFYGGMANTSLTFKINNTENKRFYYKKELWLQTIFYARKDDPTPYTLLVSRTSDFTDTNNISLISAEIVNLTDANNPEGNLSRWYMLTAVYEITDIPAAEYVKITAYQYPRIPGEHPGGATMFDRVDIDTRYFNKADFDDSGTVDFTDFSYFAEQWLK